jgi:hypothetical protein
MTERPDPQLIQELFDTDPLKLTDRDLDTIIAEFRAERVDYLQPTPEKASKAKAVKASKAPAISLDEDLLKDLGL